jgi:ABC-type lipoprotein export system ATPase subunit
MASPVIDLRNVRKAFVAPGGEIVPVLDIDSFVLDEGEQCALEGHSGSGKSTLLNVISGIMRPDTGSVYVGGHDIARFGEAARDRVRADTLGLVFQQFNLLPGFTAVENVLLAMSFGSGRPDRRRAEDLLLARALANRPRAVLADEPTASVDAANQQQVIDLLRDTCRDEGAALLVVTHDTAVAGQFPRRLRLEDFNRAARVPAARGVAGSPGPDA